MDVPQDFVFIDPREPRSDVTNYIVDINDNYVPPPQSEGSADQKSATNEKAGPQTEMAQTEMAQTEMAQTEMAQTEMAQKDNLKRMWS